MRRRPVRPRWHCAGRISNVAGMLVIEPLDVRGKAHGLPATARNTQPAGDGAGGGGSGTLRLNGAGGKS